VVSATLFKPKLRSGAQLSAVTNLPRIYLTPQAA
jgi:hypothetical protein